MSSKTRYVIRNKNLTSLPEIPKHITFLDCSKNNIEHIDSLPKNILYLDCSYNRLKNLDFIINSNLISLTIKGIKISIIKEIPKSLTFLNCSRCNLQRLPNLKNVKILICKNNRIKKLYLNDSMLYLDASRNLINFVNKIPKDLICINLFRNKLTNLPNLHENISYLSLGSNKFQPDNLPILPSVLSMYDIPSIIFKYNKPELPDYTLIKYLNGDEIDLSCRLSIEDVMNRDERKCDTENNLICYDIILSEEYNIHDYLEKSSNNIVLDINGNLYCYKRNELKIHYMTSDDYNFINRVRSLGTGEQFVKLYMREFISEEDFELLQCRKYSVYKLESFDRKIVIKEQKQHSYKVIPYALESYIKLMK